MRIHSKHYYLPFPEKWTELPANSNWNDHVEYIRELSHHPLVLPQLPAPLRVTPPQCTRSILEMLNDSDNGKILILPQYPDVVKRIARIYLEEKSVGSTCFGSARHSEMILFYDGKLYYPKSQQDFHPHDLPQPSQYKTGKRPPVWFLVDVEANEPRQLVEAMPANVFIVQTSSPNPMRFEKWLKLKKPIVIGLGLWTPKLLREGWSLQKAQRNLNSLILSWARRTGEMNEDGALAVEHQNVLSEAHPREEWSGWTDDKIISRATKLLIKQGVMLFGNSARDIYYYLQSPRELVACHSGQSDDHWQKAITYLRTYLETGVALMMEAEKSNGATRLSHRICALTLLERAPGTCWWASDLFEVIWKSKDVEEKLMEKQKSLEEEERAKLFNSLSPVGKAHSFGVNLYEPHAHKSITFGKTFLPQLRPMTLTPHSVGQSEFSASTTDQTKYTFTTTMTEYSKFEEFPRRVKHLFQYSTLPAFPQLSFDYYYVPEKENNPFFDSFFFWDLDKYVVIVFIQVSTGKDGHKKITLMGLELIENLQADAKLQFGKEVKVMYLFVSPHVEAVGPAQTWAIPARYFEDPIASYVRGGVFFLSVPIPLDKDAVRSTRAELYLRSKSAKAVTVDNVISMGRNDSKPATAGQGGCVIHAGYSSKDAAHFWRNRLSGFVLSPLPIPGGLVNRYAHRLIYYGPIEKPQCYIAMAAYVRSLCNATAESEPASAAFAATGEAGTSPTNANEVSDEESDPASAATGEAAIEISDDGVLANALSVKADGGPLFQCRFYAWVNKWRAEGVVRAIEELQFAEADFNSPLAQRRENGYLCWASIVRNKPVLAAADSDFAWNFKAIKPKNRAEATEGCLVSEGSWFIYCVYERLLMDKFFSKDFCRNPFV
ncbi:hypothetical protein BDP27DRAFT_1369120 [Rhodocollybia butyracea]|uniref:Uncharacterized protein n=1 Tax=Rhodocollybia butyracea TaxID=206335 RepID=A0A9P5PH87_9AGAR|nr:hypothetical protein BDP27DRAFT_1369120 [Rhodocollybia butyracea]